MEMSLRKQVMRSKCVCGVYVEDKMVGVLLPGVVSWPWLATKATLSLPLLNGTGERNYNKSLVS